MFLPFPFAYSSAYDNSSYEAGSEAGASAGKGLWASLHMPDHFPGQTDLLKICGHMGPAEAALLILAGIIYLLWGVKIYKQLVTINAAILGLLLGAVIGEKVGSTVAGAVIGGFTLAAVTWPLMKHAVAIMGAVFGALVGRASGGRAISRRRCAGRAD